jgi:hypothetical protein
MSVDNRDISIKKNKEFIEELIPKQYNNMSVEIVDGNSDMLLGNSFELQDSYYDVENNGYSGEWELIEKKKKNSNKNLDEGIDNEMKDKNNMSYSKLEKQKVYGKQVNAIDKEKLKQVKKTSKEGLQKIGRLSNIAKFHMRKKSGKSINNTTILKMYEDVFNKEEKEKTEGTKEDKTARDGNYIDGKQKYNKDSINKGKSQNEHGWYSKNTVEEGLTKLNSKQKAQDSALELINKNIEETSNNNTNNIIEQKNGNDERYNIRKKRGFEFAKPNDSSRNESMEISNSNSKQDQQTKNTVENRNELCALKTKEVNTYWNVETDVDKSKLPNAKGYVSKALQLNDKQATRNKEGKIGDGSSYLRDYTTVIDKNHDTQGFQAIVDETVKTQKNNQTETKLAAKLNDIEQHQRDKTTAETINQTAWNIVVTKKKPKEKLEVRRIIYEMLEALQVMDANIKLMSIPTENSNQTTITSPSTIPENEKELLEYVDHPRLNNSNKLLFRIFLSTTTNMGEFNEQQIYKKWMDNNKIKMFVSKLKTSKPLFAGFITEPNPDKFKVEFMEKRIKKQVGQNIELQVSIRPIFIEGRGNSIQVYMVLTDNDNVKKIRAKLSGELEELHPFYSWDQYMDLSYNQKLHIIQELQQNNTEYKSRLIGGFRNNIKLGSSDCSDEEHRQKHIEQLPLVPEYMTEEWPEKEESDINDMDLSTTSINDSSDSEEEISFEKDRMTIRSPNTIQRYLRINYQSNGTPMIRGIVGPIEGEIQCWYCTEQQYQTESLLDVLTVELAKNMTNKCIRDTFLDPNDMMEKVYFSSEWIPNPLLKSIPHADLTTSNNRRYKQDNTRQQKKTKLCIITKDKTNETPNQETTIRVRQDTQSIETNISKNSENDTNYTKKAHFTPTKETNPWTDPREKHTQSGINRDKIFEELMKNYCKDLIETTKNEIRQEISNTTGELRQDQLSTKIEIKNLETKITYNEKQANDRHEKLRRENNENMENIMRSQEAMMRLILDDKTKQNRYNLETTTQINTENGEYKDDYNTVPNYVRTQTKASAGNEYSQHTMRTATPMEETECRGKTTIQAARQQ